MLHQSRLTRPNSYTTRTGVEYRAFVIVSISLHLIKLLWRCIVLDSLNHIWRWNGKWTKREKCYRQKENRPTGGGILIPALHLGREVLSGSEIKRNDISRCDQVLRDRWQYTGWPTSSIWNSTTAMKKQHRDYRNQKKEVAADPKQRGHGMSERIVQQTHVRSLIPLLVGTAVRDGSLYSAYSRSQTDNFDSSAWYPKRERRQQLKQSKWL